MSWNDVYDGSEALSAIAVGQMYWTQVNHRTFGTLTGGSDSVAFPSTGDIFQSTNFWGNLQKRTQDAATLNPWLRTTALTGLAFSAVSGSTYTWTWTDIVTAALGGNGWTRKYPREYANAASTVYTDTSAFANGHNARNIADGIVYTRTAGAWVVATAGTEPDVVTAYGFATDGDYIGPWIFNELRDVLNLLVWTYLETNGTWADEARIGHDSETTNVADAEAGALAAFDSFLVTGTSPPLVGAWSDGTGFPYVADVTRARATLTNFHVSPTAAAEVDFWSQAGAPANEIGHPGVFDANGDTVTDSTLTSWDLAVAVAAGTSNTVTSAYLGSLAHPTFPAAQDGRRGGYGVGQWITVFRFDVAGGFLHA